MALPGILLIDDNKTRVQQFAAVLSFLEYPVETVGSDNCDAALARLASVGGVFVGSGCERQASLVKNVTEKAGAIPVFLLIDKGTALQVATAIEQMVAKVHEWPTTYPLWQELLNMLAQPVESPSRKMLANKGLAGNSEAILRTRNMIDQVARSDATVLILGESGTGKEVVAQALHRASSRRDKPFVPVNCGAIPGELLESELFGHEKGAFTGALASRQGRFELAEGGTLFLDEIGDMPMPMQVKLLRVLQERTFERVGSNKTVHCDVRVLAATHRHLEHEIADKRFREDLFYRLNVFPIEVPALRERTEDIPYLVSDLIGRLEAANRGSVRLTGQALALLMQHNWPGNVRELSNLIERLAIIFPGGLVDAPDLPEKFQQYAIPDGFSVQPVENRPFSTQAAAMATHSASSAAFANTAPVIPQQVQLPEEGLDLKEYLNDLEARLIRQALDECNGVVAHAAKLLNMRRTTLVEKLRKVDPERFANQIETAQADD